MPHQANIDRFSGFAGCYDAARPRPPEAAADVLMFLAKLARAKLVVDIGCGTGLSTRVWSARSERVIGVEPSADMRAQAVRATQANHIEYREGNSAQTGLPDGCADIVTCSQSLHWMEPEPTFKEVNRILRDEGVFAAIDCDWPATMGWQIEAAYLRFNEKVEALAEQHGVTARICRWNKDGHLQRMAQSGCFRFTRELLVHSEEHGNDERLMMLARSMGSVATLLKMGLSEREVGLNELQEAAARHMGPAPRPWYFSYRVRVGVK